MQIVKENWSKILVFIFSLLIIYFASFAKVDNSANSRIDISFKQALGVFATVKALNGVISLVQGTEVGPPGVTISIGEVLDPINDLVERFSWIMLAALTSLGIQKIFMNIVTFSGFEILLIVSLVLVNVIYIFNIFKNNNSRIFIFQFTVLLIFIRFSIPFMSLANQYVYDNFIQQDYNIELSQKAIKSVEKDIGDFDAKKSSIFSTNYYKQKMDDFTKLSYEASDHIVDLIIIFIFQTIFFPLVFLFILYKIIGKGLNLTYS